MLLRVVLGRVTVCQKEEVVRALGKTRRCSVVFVGICVECVFRRDVIQPPMALRVSVRPAKSAGLSVPGGHRIHEARGRESWCSSRSHHPGTLVFPARVVFFNPQIALAWMRYGRL